MQRFHRSSWPAIGRFLLGATWIVGAIFNLFVTLPGSTRAWEDLGENATFAIYRWFFASIIGIAPAFWTVMLILGEMVLGILLLVRDPWDRYGLILSVVWCVFLFFLIWPWTLSTIVFLVPSMWLLRYQHPTSLLDMFHHSEHGVRAKGA